VGYLDEFQAADWQGGIGSERDGDFGLSAQATSLVGNPACRGENNIFDAERRLGVIPHFRDWGDPEVIIDIK
jgi:hypothetical protein